MPNPTVVVGAPNMPLLKTHLAQQVFLLATFALFFQSLPGQTGKAAYELNCSACHLVDVKTVGPSLVEIAETYPADQAKAFVEWAKNPGKKDPNMIQMPAMSHVPDASLTAIHAYILEATEGKTQQRGRHQFPPFQEPERELPYVFRTFLPNSGLASIAVVLKDDISVCWDTEACRFRYAWPGSATKYNTRNAPAKIADPLYTESSSQLWSFANDAKPDFLGYRLIDGYPEFHYTYGNIEIRERIANGKTSGSIVRDFSLSGVKEPITLNLQREGGQSVESSKGELSKNTLRLTPEQAKSFHLTLTIR